MRVNVHANIDHPDGGPDVESRVLSNGGPVVLEVIFGSEAVAFFLTDEQFSDLAYKVRSAEVNHRR